MFQKQRRERERVWENIKKERKRKKERKNDFNARLEYDSNFSNNSDKKFAINKLKNQNKKKKTTTTPPKSTKKRKKTTTKPKKRSNTDVIKLKCSHHIASYLWFC